jgi:predicted TIM-barrel fold metal-dependent hydrolase
MAAVEEAALDAGRRIIDPHHHMWPPGHGSGKPYLFADLVEDAARHNVTDTVYVQAFTAYRTEGPDNLRPIGETEFAVAQARSSTAARPRLAAIVGWADMMLGDAVEEVLEAHETAGDGLFRGIRHGVTYDPTVQIGPPRPPGLLMDDAFRRALACVGRRGQTFDAWLFHPQLLELVDAARALSGTTFVLCHLGAPLMAAYGRDEARSQWRCGLQELASCPNVVMKLGGLGMEHLFGTAWASRQNAVSSDEVAAWWGDDIRWCIDTFGPSRCMFESNFPVDRGAIGYTVLWNAFQKTAAGYSDAEQDDLFAGTAARIYRIP